MLGFWLTLFAIKVHSCTGVQPENFQGRGGLKGLGHLYKHFVTNTRKKGPNGKFWGFFLQDTINC